MNMELFALAPWLVASLIYVSSMVVETLTNQRAMNNSIDRMMKKYM